MSTQRKSEPPEATPFSLLTFLLRLVTSLNVNQRLESTFKRESNDRASDPAFTCLDSVAAILVQEHEVVAACYTSNNSSVIAPAVNDPPKFDADSRNPPTDIDTHQSIDLEVHFDIYPSFAAVSNPRIGDKLNDNNNPHHVQIQNGQSLWEKVYDTERGWYCAFM
jgi:hypothetical protein